MKNPDFRSDNELIRTGDRGALDHAFGRKYVSAIWVDITSGHGFKDAGRTAAFRMDEKFRMRVERAL